MKLLTASVFFALYSTLCAYDISERSNDDKTKLENARKLLGGSDPLFLVFSANTWYEGHYICWTSKKTGHKNDGFVHNITYYNDTDRTSKPELLSRFAIWYAFMWGQRPTITLQDSNTEKPVIRKDYELVEAEPSCLVIGLIRDPPSYTLCLYFVGASHIKKNHTLCEHAHKTKCKVAAGLKYSWRKHCNLQNIPKQRK
ncbi:uncharacterized protein LOC142591237 [Dermacentor variabilis]|uniref:uncharacterized protein LOC142591237 n=1 Tax=Dermacentor variabilis TaxID=34621 RepID=UPI003F5B6402